MQNCFSFSARTQFIDLCVIFIFLIINIPLSLANTPTLIEKHEAEIILDQIHKAAIQHNYTGTITHQRGLTSHTSQIIHGFDGTHEYETIELLDGDPHQVQRFNDTVHHIFNGKKWIVTEKRNRKDGFPALLLGSSTQLLEHYQLKRHNPERYAGLEAEIYTLEPRDHYRWSHRLWVEKHQHLLLRLQTFSEQNKSLEQIGFAQVQLQNAYEKKTIHRLPLGFKVDEYKTKDIQLESLGWFLPSSIKGFQKRHEMQRTLKATSDQPEHKLLQAVYSDGLAAISIFIDLDLEGPKRPEGELNRGQTHIVIKHIGKSTVTIIGEVPLTTAKAFASAIEWRGLGH